MSNSLEERLKTHSSAFDGLLSLIPAKYYYDDATQDQWQQKKKSKRELQQNKRAKLDPDSKEEADDYVNSHASAKDVMQNKAKTAKKVELPSFGNFAKPIEKEEVEIPDMDVDEDDNENDDDNDDKSDSSDNLENSLMPETSLLEFDDDGNEINPDASKNKLNKFSKQDAQQKSNKKELSPEEKKKREENLAKLREKLNSKIKNLKEKRKAPGTKLPGAPKSREQILADRKRKEELKRQEKLKRKHDQVEEDEDSDIDSDSDEGENEKSDKSVMFGNIVFNDGSRVTSDLARLRSTADKRKQKGPANNDIKAHLQMLEQKKQKLAQMSPEEQVKQKDKDQWQRVLAQAEGIKVKDDEKLLKKALKRKEKQKLRSEIEWKERKQVVKDTVNARVKRREENLKSRRDGKGKKSKDIPRLKKFTGIVNKAMKGKKKRAGFEGSAKSNGKSKK